MADGRRKEFEGGRRGWKWKRKRGMRKRRRMGWRWRRWNREGGMGVIVVIG